MLALQRRINERIRLKDLRTGEVLGEFAIIEIDRGRIRLGFEFDKNIEIMRVEAIGKNINRSNESNNTTNES